MHILIIPSEEFIPENSHLAGIFQYHQASILSEAGYKVGVISIKQSFSIPMLVKSLLLKCFNKKANNAADDYTFSQVLALGFKKLFKVHKFIRVEKKEKLLVYRIDGFYYWPPSDVNNRMGWIKAGMAAYDAYVKENGAPQVIHAHNAVYAAMLAKKIKDRYGIRYIVTEHSTAFARNTITSPKLLTHVKESYKSSNGVYAVSQQFCNLLENKFTDVSFTCLPNVLDPGLEKRQSGLALPNKNNDFVFSNIGELHPKKNQKLLIKAFRKLKQLHPERSIKLWIGGDGILYNELKEYIHLNDLDSEVKLLGRLNREQVFDVIMQSDCFVLSSSYETFGVVLIEAMLMGKPVISTRCGGPESFVNETTGIIVEKDNEQELVDALIKMIEAANSYNPQLIKEYVIKNFGRETFIQRMNTIYNQIIVS